MVGSLDVKALYPSLDQDHAADLVSQHVLRVESQAPRCELQVCPDLCSQQPVGGGGEGKRLDWDGPWKTEEGRQQAWAQDP